jgi:hypothetical protein
MDQVFTGKSAAQPRWRTGIAFWQAAAVASR